MTKKIERLRKNSDIKEVFQKGVSFRGKYLVLFFLKKASSINKTGFVVKKTLHGKSKVLRNRFRRILREAYRNTKDTFPKGYYIILLGIALDKTTKSTVIEKDIKNVLKKYNSKINSFLS